MKVVKETVGVAREAAVMAEVAVAVGWAMAAAPEACQQEYLAGKQGVVEEEVVAGLGSEGVVKAMVAGWGSGGVEVLGEDVAGRIESQM